MYTVVTFVTHRLWTINVIFWFQMQFLCFYKCQQLMNLHVAQDRFGVRNIGNSHGEMTAAIYLQVSIISQALIFVTRSQSWSFVERPGALLMFAFLSAQLVSVFRHHFSFNNSIHMLQLHWTRYSPFNRWVVWSRFAPYLCSRLVVRFRETSRTWMNEVDAYINLSFPQIATFIAVYANWGFAHIQGCGWGWAGIVWLFSIVTYIPLDILKFTVRYIQSGKAWNNLINRKV